MAANPYLLLRAVRNNWRLKLISVALAVFAWYAVREFTSYTSVVREVRVNVLLDEGWAVLDRSVEDVDVLCRGSQSDIRYLTRDQVRVEVDLRGRSVPGAIEVPLRPQNVKISGGARAVSVEPPELTLTLDREGERVVRVRPDIVGNPPEGFELAEITATPAEVRLQGPQGRLAAVSEVRTAPIDLEGRLKSFSLTRTILPPSELWSARVDPDRARVDVRIVERSSAAELSGIPIRLLVPPGTPQIRIIDGRDQVKLTIRGRADAVRQLTTTNVTAFVDCSGLEPGRAAELPVLVNAPAGVEIVNREPSHITVQLL
ncbi:MAG: CdaR family protein [Kiritimatiellae bacterium]|nr:CdaR family protein [Kiritimatiellia bacterium]MDW8457997.1 CdaR family protein [Verrucomicrobiota bacterium]